ncbi:hypothetical protein GCM10007036_07970 [Alsobacter metallidurans]|uniref:Uncharacterized protein n=1 Tax=Alsobacter metallidurans TaxID=340221 RepID=A0A917I4V0_9HYPH|nr:hypothetical protein [Alsobacter metallidurans]GGH11107.1 hypothetical protein GCM10007036_07970 [Alsobacter metallidurans]
MSWSVFDCFTARRRAIEVARSDDDFRLLCEDLTAAEAAAHYWESQHTDVGRARSAEYRILVQELAEEVEAMLKLRTKAGSRKRRSP